MSMHPQQIIIYSIIALLFLLVLAAIFPSPSMVFFVAISTGVVIALQTFLILKDDAEVEATATQQEHPNCQRKKSPPLKD